jgi:large subunit ribosomal protein L25
MAQVITIEAQRRDRAGKGAARQTRREGLVPGVVYGNKEQPLLVAMEFHKFDRVLRTPGFFTHLVDLAVDGATHRVLPRDVQFDPVTDRVTHVDFLRVSSGTTITVMIPVEFVNQDKSPGLKRGAVLTVVRHEIEVEAPADAIPERITVDCSGFDVAESIHISAVKLPEGVKPTISDRDFTIATISAPSGLKSEEASAEGSAA